ncbi:uncharacterized protein LOC120354333 [Nilaparvata lugens]|uniref:uncharacterized protein LOC120354333 n=1 Tax=Nilaparvata lugens TaxID=108931 RepID=UPI00193D695B|nr:uncharacterized protein LOC120354333 [Nilaparvata lugens]
MEWTNEIVIEFLDLYEQEPIIWNPVNEEHKDRNKVYDAWKRIQSNFSIECSLKELKKKKENLMATYRKLSAKVKKTSKTGSVTFQVYHHSTYFYTSQNLHQLVYIKLEKSQQFFASIILFFNSSLHNSSKQQLDTDPETTVLAYVRTGLRYDVPPRVPPSHPAP